LHSTLTDDEAVGEDGAPGAGAGSGKGKRRFPAGMTNKKSNSNDEYKGLSAASAKARTPVEMTNICGEPVKQVLRYAQDDKVVES
jgi:hypothetical protein